MGYHLEICIAVTFYGVSFFYTRNISTLNIISVTYYLELRNAISIYCTSHISSTNVKLVVWTLLECSLTSLLSKTLL